MRPLEKYSKHAEHIYTMQTIRKKLRIALQIDNIGDPITVVTKRIEKSDRSLIGDIRVQFPRKRAVLTTYDQQRAPVRNKQYSDNRILTQDGHISPTIIPTGHMMRHYTKRSFHVNCSEERTTANSRYFSGIV